MMEYNVNAEGNTTLLFHPDVFMEMNGINYNNDGNNRWNHKLSQGVNQFTIMIKLKYLLMIMSELWQCFSGVMRDLKPCTHQIMQSKGVHCVLHSHVPSWLFWFSFLKFSPVWEQEQIHGVCVPKSIPNTTEEYQNSSLFILKISVTSSLLFQHADKNHLSLLTSKIYCNSGIYANVFFSRDENS